MRENLAKFLTGGNRENGDVNKMLSRLFHWNECLRPPSPFILSPRERKWLLIVPGFADERPTNPVVYIFKRAANDTPSPGGEGWGGRMSSLHP
jgi:hypothetical protein